MNCPFCSTLESGKIITKTTFKQTCFLLLDFCTIIPKVLLVKLFRHFGWCAEPLENFDPCLYFPFLPPLSRIKEASTPKPGNLFKFLLSKCFHTTVTLPDCSKWIMISKFLKFSKIFKKFSKIFKKFSTFSKFSKIFKNFQNFQKCFTRQSP